MKARLVYVMKVWGAAAICEGWSSLLSHVLIEVERDVKTDLTITKSIFIYPSFVLICLVCCHC